ERGDERKAQRDQYLEEALAIFQRTIELDPENVTAHYNLSRLYQRLGNKELGDEHLALYQKYKPDDNARDQVIARHRAAHPAADHAAQAIVVYDLRRPGAYELDGEGVGKAEEFALHFSGPGPVAGVD
ncbi:MAG: tetratricopeptide repeat protein, partial [Thermoanaerobaculia bacterium]|nr:tetratricopeptide repeat protein [Thermoanaerobaculia bacterium]